jgi:peptidoglycan/xylan/chitin deacetylase (PgdA/CDA1 family)
MIKRLVLVGISLACHLGVVAADGVTTLITGRRREKRPVVLTYHAVSPEEIGGFTRQMRLLRRRFTPVFADAVASPRADRPVAVTFDDGFDCVFAHALPLLERLDIPATVFVPTAYLGTEARWSSDGPLRGRTRQVVSAAALKTLDPSRVRVGSHSATHAHLAALSPEPLARELRVSRSTLEALTGMPVTLLALPYGCYTGPVIRAAHEHGYERVFGNVPLRPGPPILHGRCNVSPRDWRLEFYLKAAGGYAWMGAAVAAKRALRALVGLRRVC